MHTSENKLFKQSRTFAALTEKNCKTNLLTVKRKHVKPQSTQKPNTDDTNACLTHHNEKYQTIHRKHFNASTDQSENLLGDWRKTSCTLNFLCEANNLEKAYFQNGAYDPSVMQTKSNMEPNWSVSDDEPIKKFLNKPTTTSINQSHKNQNSERQTSLRRKQLQIL